MRGTSPALDSLSSLRLHGGLVSVDRVKSLLALLLDEQKSSSTVSESSDPFLFIASSVRCIGSDGVERDVRWHSRT